MDGSERNAGTMTTSTSLSLDPGLYTLKFDLAGNHRNNSSETVTVDVMLGAFSNSYSLARYDPFTTFTETFTITDAGTYNLRFAGSGGDNIGMLLDNVSVAAVPVPAAVWLGVLGLSAAGLKLRRRSA